MSGTRPRTLAPGQQVGPYLIHSLLGVGGMGEVYRARDTRLERDVAIKVLPQEFTGDPDRLARFQREARVLASLNHPNIASIYGFDDSTGVTALALEFVDGLTLADLIARGPVVFQDAIHVAQQICEALEAAHEQGIVHRDLKPTNIKLRSDGVVKVLDFGLAKAWEPPSAPDLTHSPTITTPAITRIGVILGTAAYMSPEQAKGRSADKRSDIFAFGCVLFEILSSRRAFDGDDVAETLAAILRAEPDWSALPAGLPQPIHRLLRRCLEKDRRRRIADIGDVRFELEEASREPGTAVPPLMPAGRQRLLSGGPRAGIGVVAAALICAAAWSLWPARTAVLPTERVPIPVESGLQLVTGPSIAVAPSPDGRRLIYVASIGGTSRLMLREIDRFGASVIPGTEGASAPFLSPDGGWVGYFARNALWKVQVRGGIAQKIAELPSFVSGSWGPDGSIVFSTASPGEGLWRIGVDGGTPEVLTTPDLADGERQHSYPHFVDTGTQVVFTVVKADASYPAVLQLGSRSWRTVPQLRFDSGGVQHVPTGHLVYSLAGQLMAVPFDIGRHSVTGPAFSIEERLDSRSGSVAQFAVSTGGSGMLVFVPVVDAARQDTLILLERNGRSSPLIATPATYRHPRFSRDGQHLAVAVETDGGSDVWVYNLRRQTRVRLTTSGACEAPVWSSDGSTVSFYVANAGRWTLQSRAADGSTPAVAVLTHEPPAPTSPAISFGGLLPGTVPRLAGTHPQFPSHWMNREAVLAFVERKPNGERDIWVTSPDGEPVPFLVTPFDESSPVFSPDGRFLAYVSNESGANEVYVQSFPGPGGRWLISSDGGDEPLWSPDGRELIYRRDDTIVAVSVQTRPTFMAGAQERLFQVTGAVGEHVRNFDISPDGRQFVIVKGEERYRNREIRLVRNWFQELLSARPGP